MSNVIRAFDIVTLEQKRQYKAMDTQIAEAIDEAKSAGVPQGLIVALLHGYAHHETATMMDDA